MAISFIGQAGAGGSGTDMSVTHGLTIQSGDVLVCCIAFDRPTALTVADNNGGTPFTEDLDEQAGGSYTIGGYVGHRVAGASEPSSYSWTLSSSDGYSLMLLQFRGVDNSVIYDVSPTTPSWNTQTSVSCVADAVTATASGTEGIFFSVADSSSASYSSIDNSYLNENEPLGSLRGATYRRNFSSSGSTGTTTATLASSKKNANIQFLLNPDAGGASANPKGVLGMPLYVPFMGPLG